MRSAGVVLAAGGSRRLGEPKQLLPYKGRPLLQWVIDAVCASRLDEVVVVLGADATRIAGRLDIGRARVVINEGYADGMSTSLQLGVWSLAPDIERAVIILGDQPDVDAPLLDRLLDVHQGSGLPAAAVEFEGLLHPPVVLARGMWSDLAQLRGDVGCRQILRARPEEVARLPSNTPRRHPVDIDTPEDFHRLVADQSSSGSSVTP
jgi:molybdenum cofactor cytidylyltransferase